MKVLQTLFLFLFLSSVVLAQSYNVTAEINGENEVPANETEGTGTLTGTYNTSTNEITLNVSYSNLGSNLSSAHLHKAAAGTNGGVMVGLTTSANMSGTITGTYTIQASDEADLLAGNVYINLHTVNNGGGEIRGQLVLSLPPPPASKELEIAAGDLFIKDNTRGVILKSPNGSCYRIQVSNTGIITATALTCP